MHYNNCVSLSVRLICFPNIPLALDTDAYTFTMDRANYSQLVKYVLLF